MLSRLDTIPECDGQTDRISILISHVSIAVLMCDKMAKRVVGLI